MSAYVNNVIATTDPNECSSTEKETSRGADKSGSLTCDTNKKEKSHSGKTISWVLIMYVHVLHFIRIQLLPSVRKTNAEITVYLRILK